MLKLLWSLLQQLVRPCRIHAKVCPGARADQPCGVQGAQGAGPQVGMALWCYYSNCGCVFYSHCLKLVQESLLFLRVPPSSFSVSDIKRCVGARRMLDVVDTRTQEGLVMSVQQWARYFESKPRERILNVISLEFSHSKMDSLVLPPFVVGPSFLERRLMTPSSRDVHLYMVP